VISRRNYEELGRKITNHHDINYPSLDAVDFSWVCLDNNIRHDPICECNFSSCSEAAKKWEIMAKIASSKHLPAYFNDVGRSSFNRI
jgi:hypothetical protein